jgi:hypothetical protein
MEKIQEDAKELCETDEEYKKLSHCFSGVNYISKLEYTHTSSSENPNFPPKDHGKILIPELCDPKGFEGEIKKIFSLIMNLPKMKSDNYQSEEKENMEISFYYILGFIEEDIYPDIIQEL